MNGATGELGLKNQMNAASPTKTIIIGSIHQSFRFLRNSRNSDRKLMILSGAAPVTA
jgi:hypothetical protein